MSEEALKTISEAARILGLKESTIRKWRFKRSISVVRVGSRSIRVPLSEILRIIERGRQPAITE